MLKTVFEKLFKLREATARARTSRPSPGADDGYDPYEKPFLDHLEDLRKTMGKVLIALIVATVATFAFNVQIFEFIQLPAKLAKLDDGSTLFEHINFLTLRPQEILMLSIKVAFIAAVILTFPILVWFIGEFIMPGLKQSEKRYVVPGVSIGFVLFLLGASFAFFLACPIALKFFYAFYLERTGAIAPPVIERVEKLSYVEAVPVKNPPKPAGKPATGDSAKPEANSAPAPATPETPKSDAVSDATPDAGESPTLGKEGPQLDPETRAAVRNYLTQLIAVERNSQLAVYYDESRDKLIISQNSTKSVNYGITEYINFITRLTLVFGISFQLPVIVTILVKLELLTARVMQSTRSYAWVVILVAAAILTPPDVFTLMLLGGPLILLYEICIVIALFMERARRMARASEEATEQERLALLYSKSPEDLSEEEKAELHRREIEQYEKEHAHLYEEESSHIPHDPDRAGHGHGDDDDERFRPYDPDHDTSWHDGEHGREYHDPYHDHDYHAGEDPHEPVQDWPYHPEGSGDLTDEDDHVQRDETDPTEICEPSGPLVNLNSATKEQLLSLPGIGPALAKRLIEHRPFVSFDEVTAVPGITDSLLNKFIDRLSIDAVDEEDDFDGYGAEDSEERDEG
ncbi:MAG: twin-arginine translocase subunit TatC [Akkermansiaceae bacterium]|nr:twin-arginine translocase subunit TatC [Akkermansiaceae bacterium]MCP5550644.1 twin-arginine translocase subunit TatC [Akkermansiaceae bacterium]